jgi:hypothetical protein
VTRYAVKVNDRWVMAAFGPGKGLQLTSLEEDASSWPTYERALRAAHSIQQCTSNPISICSVTEPTYR